MSTTPTGDRETMWPAVQAVQPFVYKDALTEAPQMALPPGWKRESLADDSLAPPWHIDRVVTVADSPSFLAYFARYAVNPSVYAWRRDLRISATLNDHKDGAKTDHASHYLYRPYVHSREFQRWHDANKKAMTQLEFATFLEDAIVDVTSPEQGALMQMVLSFKAFKSATLQSSVDLANGDVNFNFTADSKSSGAVTFPDHLMLSIPVFEHEGNWNIAARLRHRVDGNTGKLQFWYELIQVQDIIDRAFDTVVADLQTKLTGHTILRCP